jgi:predicted AAA+ superfamily ATPase
MKRRIYSNLIAWKNDKNHRPLILRGARQVGKTYIINEFGQNEFDSIITINFEKNPEYKEIFTTYDPTEIVNKISLITGQKIIPEKTLLFLDEIQECIQAITSLRYFYEEFQPLHIIAAGSLLEFALESENFSMPVGRVQYLYMFPISFGEFLDALHEEDLHNHLRDIDNLASIPDMLHNKLSEYIRKYFLIGGMPGVVNEYCDSKDILKCQIIQRAIIDTYMDDFGKYARKIKHRYLLKIFNAVPTMVGQKFVYARVDSTIKSRELKEALEMLEKAGVITRVNKTGGSGIPLEAGVQEQYFKMLFLDVGLLHAVNDIYSDTAQTKDFNAVFNGAVAEQFVGQELLAYQSPYSKPKLFYWTRDAKNSKAEVDYLTTINNSIIPIEVKSGTTGKLKSLKIFLDKYESEYGFKISQSRFSSNKPIISIPFYTLENFL